MNQRARSDKDEFPLCGAHLIEHTPEDRTAQLGHIHRHPRQGKDLGHRRRKLAGRVGKRRGDDHGVGGGVDNPDAYGHDDKLVAGLEKLEESRQAATDPAGKQPGAKGKFDSNVVKLKLAVG